MRLAYVLQFELTRQMIINGVTEMKIIKGMTSIKHELPLICI